MRIELRGPDAFFDSGDTFNNFLGQYVGTCSDYVVNSGDARSSDLGGRDSSTSSDSLHRRFPTKAVS